MRQGAKVNCITLPESWRLKPIKYLLHSIITTINIIKTTSLDTTEAVDVMFAPPLNATKDTPDHYYSTTVVVGGTS